MQVTTVVARPAFAAQRCRAPLRRAVVTARAEEESKVTRAYSEGDEKVSVPGLKPGEKPNSDGTFYIDQAAEPKRPDVMSKEMKDRLRDEYVGWGGAPNKPLSSNPFLFIILVISALAVAAKLSGALDGLP